MSDNGRPSAILGPPPAPPMAPSAEYYQEGLSRLLPPGPAWARVVDSRLGRFLLGVGAEFARAHAAIMALVTESDPRTADATMDAWERNYGLPAPCVTDPPTDLAGRQLQLHAKVTATGIRTPAEYVAQAALLGYSVTITEPFQFSVGDPCETPCWDEDWNHTFIVNGAYNPEFFTVDASAVEDPLVSWAEEPLECLLTSLKPAHTVALFYYT